MEEKLLTEAEKAATKFEGLPKLLYTAKDIEKKLKKKELDYPGIGSYLLKVYTQISDLYSEENAYKKALKFLKKALNVCEIMASINFEVYGKPFYLTKLKLYSYYHEIDKNDKKADKYLFEGLDIYEQWCKLLPEHYPDLLSIYDYFAVLAFWNIKKEESFRMKEYEIIKEIYKQWPEKYAEKYAKACQYVARKCVMEHKDDEANQLYLECINIQRKFAEEDYDANKYELAWIYKDYGDFLIKINKRSEAQPYLIEAVKVFEEENEHKEGKDRILNILISAVNSLGVAYSNDKQKCRECFDRAIELIQSGIEEEPTEFKYLLAKTYLKYGEIFKDKELTNKGEKIKKTMSEEDWRYGHYFS